MKQIIKLFKENGYQLWQVGGSVRDELMKIEPNDIDFATDATPDEMIKTYSDNVPAMKRLRFTWYASENGRAHGTIVFKEDDVDYEITTFRKDVSTDGRNATVEFAKTIGEDLSRRDFTINSIAKCMLTGEIVDPHNGQQDIKDKVIKFVGLAHQRIEEDKLRVIRAYRFLSQLGKGWKFIDSTTVNMMDMSKLDVLSKERIREELIKMFKHNPVFAIYHMPIRLLMYLFGEHIYGFDFHGHFHAENICNHSMFALASATRISFDPLLRMSVFLHDVGKNLRDETNDWGYPIFIGHEIKGAEVVEKWMQEMKFSKKEIHYITQLIRHHMVQFTLLQKTASNKSIKRYVMKLGEELLNDMLVLNYCDRIANLAHTEVCEYQDYVENYTIMPRWREIREKDDCFKISDLKVDGHDIIKKGYDGKEIGMVLQELFWRVENNLVDNIREDLLKIIPTRGDKPPSEWFKRGNKDG